MANTINLLVSLWRWRYLCGCGLVAVQSSDKVDGDAVHQLGGGNQLLGGGGCGKELRRGARLKQVLGKERGGLQRRRQAGADSAEGNLGELGEAEAGVGVELGLQPLGNLLTHKIGRQHPLAQQQY